MVSGNIRLLACCPLEPFGDRGHPGAGRAIPELGREAGFARARVNSPSSPCKTDSRPTFSRSRPARPVHGSNRCGGERRRRRSRRAPASAGAFAASGGAVHLMNVRCAAMPRRGVPASFRLPTRPRRDVSFRRDARHCHEWIASGGGSHQELSIACAPIRAHFFAGCVRSYSFHVPPFSGVGGAILPLTRVVFSPDFGSL